MGENILYQKILMVQYEINLEALQATRSRSIKFEFFKLVNHASKYIKKPRCITNKKLPNYGFRSFTSSFQKSNVLISTLNILISKGQTKEK